MKNAAATGDRDDLHRVLAAGYAAAMLEKEPELADVAAGLKVLAERGNILKKAC